MTTLYINVDEVLSLHFKDVELDKKEQSIIKDLCHSINLNNLALPVKPDIALKIISLIKDKNVSMEELVNLIQMDPSISGELIHFANGPLFRANRPITSIKEALVRLGLRNSQMLMVNLAIKNLFKSDTPSIKTLMDELWVESVWCSIFTYLLSDKLNVLDKERALLAGLIANVGGIPILAYIEAHQWELKEDTIRQLVHHLSPVTGVLVGEYWNLGVDLSNAIKHHRTWEYDSSTIEYTHLVLVARWDLTRMFSENHPDPTTVPSFNRLNLPYPKEGEGIGCLECLEREIDQMKRLFNVN